MKRYLILIFSALITSLTILTGCQDEDFGFTQEEVFKGAYERNFEAKYGKIDPNQSWDLSTHAKEQNQNSGSTRAGMNEIVTLVDEWFEVDNSMISWIKNKSAVVLCRTPQHRELQWQLQSGFVAHCLLRLRSEKI